MGLEIERKFLIDENKFNEVKHLSVRELYINQSYFVKEDDCTVRLRVTEDSAFLTIKGRKEGLTCTEYEYEISREDGLKMASEKNLCKHHLVKRRFVIDYKGWLWEVDVFEGDLSGLIVAELEIPSENTLFPLPPWVTSEVSGDRRYFNSVLAEEGKPA